MAKLVLLQGGESIPYELTEDEVVLGRHPECSVQINSNMVSRKHARVVRDAGKYLLEDLNSGNGTFINGKKIDAATTLKHEDRVKLGPVLLRFEDASSPRPKASAMPSATAQFPNFSFATDEEDGATVMSTSTTVGGFGSLTVQPEAKLKAVLEISRALAGSVDVDTILPTILETLFRIFPLADRGVILFKEDGKLVPRHIKHRREEDDESVKLSRTILNKVMEQKSGILSADATSDARFQASESISSLTIRSVMCVPMLNLAQEVMGVIHIDTQSAFNQFTPEDLDLLVAVAGQAALSYETTRLLVTAIQKEKQDREMDIATGVQRALLPEKMPKVANYDLFASYDSAQAVGGDYYDCMLLDDDHLCFAFGDVAGKGVPASLVMSRLSSVVQNVMAFVRDVGQAAARINNQMCAKAVEGRFVTFVLGIVHLPTGKVEMVNAGHMPPIKRRPDGSIEEISPDLVGVPLGVMEDFPFDVASFILGPGELCVIYTDGVSEAMNPNNDLYGIERLQTLVRSAPIATAPQLGSTILQDVRKFAAGRDQNDDITMMVVSRTAS